MMKKRRLIAVIIFIVVLFLGTRLNVNAENYVATSAPDEIQIYSMASLGDPRLSEEEHANLTGNPIMSNDSLITANNGGLHSYYNGITAAKEYHGFVIDLHTKHSFVNGTWVLGNKLFIVDSMLYPYEGSIEHTITKSGDYADNGIVYIIVNAQNYLSKNGIDERLVYKRNLELSWFTQIAIWKYQDINNFSKVTFDSNEIYEAGFYLSEGLDINRYEYKKVWSNRAATLWNLADGLVAEAKRANSNATINLNYDGNFSIQEENNNIKTSLIYPTINGSISSYSLDISKAPQGTKVYNESNRELTNLTSIPSNTKFYLEIPVENIENFTYDFNVTATITNGDYTGYKYKKKLSGNGKTADSTVVLVTHEPPKIHSTIEVKATHVEDSASSFSKVIYMVGLFILLCGVGIIYVNMKPKKQGI